MAIRGYLGQRDEWASVMLRLAATPDVMEARLPLAAAETYKEVGEYDPVLRAHCRLDSAADAGVRPTHAVDAQSP